MENVKILPLVVYYCSVEMTDNRIGELEDPKIELTQTGYQRNIPKRMNKVLGISDSTIKD